MKKRLFLYPVLIVLVAASLVIFARAICDDDINLDMLCNLTEPLRYHELLAGIASQEGTFYGDLDPALAPPSIISYLARHEKSPPSPLLS
jgi:hypothetical protein